MNESTNSPAEQRERHGIFSWLLFPLALFPLAALLTYDWQAMPWLQSPPSPTSNWIGELGDGFAYYGYLHFGLAIWIVPALCIIAGLCLTRGRRIRPGRRELWFLILLVATAGLLQVIGGHANSVSVLTRRLNIPDAGGTIGYLLMTRFLSPLISDFGSAIVMVILIAIALVASIGAHNLADFIRTLIGWATAGRQPARLQAGADGPLDAQDDPAVAQYQALMAAKEAARLQREEEKRLAKEAKLQAKEEKRRLKEEARLAREAGREATREPVPEPSPAPQPAPVPVPAPQPAPAAAPRAVPQAKAAAAESPAGQQEDKGPYLLPPLSLLNPLKKSAADHGDVDEMSKRLIDTLKLFGVDATMSFTVQGPVVTKYALRLAPGIRYSAVTNIQDNLMGALHAKSLRIEAPIPGKEEVGIEVPNRAPAGISFREIFESEAWRNFKGELPLLFGKDAAGNELVADLASMPHMLVAGATGQGKSVCLNSLINGLLMTRTPEQLKLIMVDPKSVEFANYVSIPHLIVPIITENKKVVFSLQWAVVEMDKRLKLFARARCKNIYDFNHRKLFTQTDMFGNDTAVGGDMPKTVPYIVIIIDEVADLMSQCAKEVSPHIARLTAKARAAGIHLILATQRPDAKIITGAIKANIPGRVAFKTASAVDSRTILDDSGAENLIGRGDMLFKGKDGLLVRAQGAWISDPEIISITQFIEQHSNVQFDDRFSKKLSTIKEAEIDLFADPEADAAAEKQEAQAAREQVKADVAASDFKKAIQCIINTNRASTSHFQRQMGWGYNHAAKILDMLTERGVVSQQQGMGPRQIIMSQEELLAVFNGDETSAAEAIAGGSPGTEPAAGTASDETAASEAAGDDSSTEELL